MSPAATPTLLCPKCGSGNTTLGGSGNGMCADCSHYWDPSDPATVVDLAPQPFAMAPTEEVYPESVAHLMAGDMVESARADLSAQAPPVEPDGSWRDAMTDYIGGTAVLEGGQVAVVISFTESDEVVVRLSNDDIELVPFDNVQRIMLPPEPVEQVAIPDDSEGLPADIALSLKLAALIVRAGVESVNGTGENVTPGFPPIGYLPVEPELHEVIERAAGLAVALLIEHFEMDTDEILQAVGATSEASEEATTTTEDETSDTSTGDTEQ